MYLQDQRNGELLVANLDALVDPSILARLTVWRTLWRAFLVHPWVGYGQESVAAVLTSYGVLRPQQDAPYDRAHNILLEWLISAGVLGLAAYLSLFACAGYRLWRRGGVDSMVVASILVAGFVYNLFQFDTLMSYIIFFSLLAFSTGVTETK